VPTPIENPPVYVLPLQDDANDEVNATWEEELRRRVEQIKTGTATLYTSAEVHAEARRICEQRLTATPRSTP
jgi:Putative addiction module component